MTKPKLLHINLSLKYLILVFKNHFNFRWPKTCR